MRLCLLSTNSSETHLIFCLSLYIKALGGFSMETTYVLFRIYIHRIELLYCLIAFECKMASKREESRKKKKTLHLPKKMTSLERKTLIMFF